MRKVEMKTVDVEFTFAELRAVAKSIGKTLDVDARKLTRLKKGTPVYIDVLEDYDLLDAVSAKVRSALSELLDDTG